MDEGAEATDSLVSPSPDSVPPAAEAARIPTPNEALLMPGISLTTTETHAVCRRGRTTVIILAGDVDSGKTTLMTSIYDQFQLGSFAGWTFGGSETLLGFEERCHLSRVHSLASRADTTRTPFGERPQWLHLALASTKPLLREMLVSDLSGEVFEHIQDTPSLALDVPGIGRCDHFVIVIDGEKLASPGLRHEAVEKARLVLRAVVEHSVLRPSCAIDLVVSKYDLLQSSNVDPSVIDRAFAKFDSILTGTRFPVSNLITAARPLGHSFAAAIGLADLLGTWMDVSAPQVLAAGHLPSADRMFLRYDTARQ